MGHFPLYTFSISLVPVSTELYFVPVPWVDTKGHNTRR